MGKNSGYRARLFKAIHAEAAKRRIDHDGLHDVCSERFGVRSMSDLSDVQLHALYRAWTGKQLKRRASLPRRGADPVRDMQMVSGEEAIMLEQEYAKRGWGKETSRNFVRRQLRGREEIRTYKDWRRVFQGVRAMNRREGK